MTRRRTRKGGVRPPGGDAPLTLHMGNLYYKVYKSDGTIKNLLVPTFSQKPDEYGHVYIPPDSADVRDPDWDDILERGDILKAVYNAGYYIGQDTVHEDDDEGIGSPILDIYSEVENPPLPPEVKIEFRNPNGGYESLYVRFDRWEKTADVGEEQSQDVLKFSEDTFGPRAEPPASANWPVGAGAGSGPPGAASGGRRKTRRRRQRGGANEQGDLHFDVYVNDQKIEKRRIRELFPNWKTEFEARILKHVERNGYIIEDRLTEIMPDHLDTIGYIERPVGHGIPPDYEILNRNIRIKFTFFETNWQRIEREAAEIRREIAGIAIDNRDRRIAAGPIGAAAGPIGAGAGLPPLAPRALPARALPAAAAPASWPVGAGAGPARALPAAAAPAVWPVGAGAGPAPASWPVGAGAGPAPADIPSLDPGPSKISPEQSLLAYHINELNVLDGPISKGRVLENIILIYRFYYALEAKTGPHAPILQNFKKSMNEAFQRAINKGWVTQQNINNIIKQIKPQAVIEQPISQPRRDDPENPEEDPSAKPGGKRRSRKTRRNRKLARYVRNNQRIL